MLIKDFWHILSGRVARNVYFWIGTAIFMYYLNFGADIYPRSAYLKYKVATTFLLFALTCLNNFWLVPRTLGRRKGWWFVFGMIAETILFAVFYVLLIKNMLASYPDMEVYEVSLITSPVSTDWAFSAFVEEVPTFAFGLVLWVAAFTMAWYMNEYRKQERLALEASQKHKEAELHLLRNQLNPHFLFNTLNNIYGLTLKKSDVAPEAVLKLSSLMRYMLYDTEGKHVPFDKEKEMMQAYIEMEKLRLKDSDNMQFTISADRNYMIPPLLWMPVLENVFKHGTRMITDDYYINFSFTIENNILNIHSENKYKQENTNGKVGGVGLDNLRRRLNILYPDKHSISEDITDDTYSITIKAELN